MTPDNSVKVVRYLSKRKRFRPYTIVFEGDERIDVKHPEVVQIQGTVLVFQHPDGSQMVFDGSSVNRILIA